MSRIAELDDTDDIASAETIRAIRTGTATRETP